MTILNYSILITLLALARAEILYTSPISLTAPCELHAGAINIIRCLDETHILSDPIRKQVSSEILDVRSYPYGASFIEPGNDALFILNATSHFQKYRFVNIKGSYVMPEVITYYFQFSDTLSFYDTSEKQGVFGVSSGKIITAREL